MSKTTLLISTAFLTVLMTVTVSSGIQSIPTVAILEPLHFLDLKGNDTIAPPGPYVVSPEGIDGLTLRSTEGDTVLTLQADGIAHEGALDFPQAFVMPGEEGAFHIMLLLPNGIGFEATGSPTGIQARGMKRKSFTHSRVNRALATMRPIRPKPGNQPPQTTTPNTSEPTMLRAVQQPSPELQQINQSGGEAPSHRRRGVRELLDTIRSMPGGPALIDRARMSGARISQETQPRQDYLSWLDWFYPSEAYAQNDPPNIFSVTLSPAQPKVGPHYLTFQYVNIQNNASVVLHTHSKNVVIPKSISWLWVQVPTTGWYIVNVEAKGECQLNPAFLRHRDPEKKGTGPFAGLKMWTDPPVQAWNNPHGQESHPALVQLEAGNHEFAFYAGDRCFLTFLETNVYALPSP